MTAIECTSERLLAAIRATPEDDNAIDIEFHPDWATRTYSHPSSVETRPLYASDMADEIAYYIIYATYRNARASLAGERIMRIAVRGSLLGDLIDGLSRFSPGCENSHNLALYVTQLARELSPYRDGS